MLCPGGACIDDGGCTNGMVSQRRACRHFVGEMWFLRSGLKDGDWRLENLRQSSPKLCNDFELPRKRWVLPMQISFRRTFA